MKRCEAKGSLTVFFSLITTLVLSLICTGIESVRIQGARAQAVNVAGLGNYSVFGEFEKKLLEDYELFAVNGAYGTGDFSIERVNDRLKHFISCNTNVQQEGLEGLCFEPWKLKLKSSKIREYALLTDQNGEAFYQQAVAYMKATAATSIMRELFQYYTDSQIAKEGQEYYEKEKRASAVQMQELEKTEEEKKQESLQKESEETGLTTTEGELSDAVKKENPLKTINKLKRKSLLRIVCGSAEISSKTVSNGRLASKRSRKKGTMKIKEEHGGLASDLLFREYLLDRFPDYRNRKDSGAGNDTDSNAGSDTEENSQAEHQRESRALDYQIEYILCGKKSDEQNLKATVQKLLLLREGMNYLYIVGNGEMNAQAGSLAALLIGWIGIPALVAVLKHALILGWAYGESLLDVRVLLDGGKIPLNKTSDTWMVTLDNLGILNELLEEGGMKQTEGITYKDYLRMLFCLQSLTQQKRRALDLLELNLKTVPGFTSFQVDHCVVGMKETTEWEIAPVFLRVPMAFLRLAGESWTVSVDSVFAYD